MIASPILKHVSMSVTNIIHILKYLKGERYRVFGNNAKVFLTGDNRAVPDVSIVCNKNILKKMVFIVHLTYWMKCLKMREVSEHGKGGAGRNSL